MELLLVPICLFLIIVAPIWLTFHYRYKTKMSKGISETDLQRIEKMLATIDTLTDRISTLEDILDKRDRHWKEGENPR